MTPSILTVLTVIVLLYHAVSNPGIIDPLDTEYIALVTANVCVSARFASAVVKYGLNGLG